VRSVVNITTDKVYQNMEWERGYRETDVLNGYDPYSNSKSCSELVTASYRSSFFQNAEVAVSTARAGNVIGGGDFAPDRIIPDCVRAAERGVPVILRNPDSTRPFQHVLDPLFAYLLIAREQYRNALLADCYNIGPNDEDCITTGALADLFAREWGDGMTWEVRSDGGPHEAHFLKLDCKKMRDVFGWDPVWDIGTAVEKTVEWSKTFIDKGDVRACMDRQIAAFFLKAR
jgi:CDP-glucose 4,6-dehydratase